MKENYLLQTRETYFINYPRYQCRDTDGRINYSLFRGGGGGIENHETLAVRISNYNELRNRFHLVQGLASLC